LYVSTSGNDSNAGTSSSAPLKTLAAAAAKAKAGTTVMIAGGTYYEQLVTKVGGSAGQEIVFQSYNGTAVIDGSKLGWKVHSNQNQGLVELRHPYVKLKGLKIVNSNNTGVLLNHDNLTVDSCEIAQIQWHAISTETSRQTGYNNGKMIRNAVIRGNDIHHATIYGDGQVVSLVADGFTVSGNKIHDNKKEGIDIWLGAKHGEVVDNTVYNNSVGIFVDGASYVRIHRNRAYNNVKAGIGVSSEDVRYS
ncbi:right-handed parallel beta-helix repeat-containing protein, partial [bacterium]|nr:right-handed parallel beta-helix repeat-containing protein [bacterium]